MLGEVVGPRVIAVADIGRQFENYGERLFLSVRTIHSGVESNAVAHGDLDRPHQVNQIRQIGFLGSLLGGSVEAGKEQKSQNSAMAHEHLEERRQAATQFCLTEVRLAWDGVLAIPRRPYKNQTNTVKNQASDQARQ
jgi:hypothetical protein